MKNFFIDYNTFRLFSRFRVDEFGGMSAKNGFSFEESRVNDIMHFIVKGVCRLTIWEGDEEKHYDVQEGEGFLIRAGIRHRYENFEACDRYWLSLSGEDVEDVLKKCEIFQQDIIVKGLNVTKIHSVYKKFLKNINSDNSVVAVYCHAFELLDLLSKGNTEKALPQSNKQHGNKKQLVEEIMRYVDENHKKGTSVAAIAKKFGYERTYLYRVFMQEKGFSLQHYLISCRVQYARCLLVETNLALEDVAEAVGYTDVSAFSRTFKHYSGVSPGKYRIVYRKK